MQPGDFVITPSWTWHHHGHEAHGPMVWLGGLDNPVTHVFGSTFRKEREHDEATITRPTGDALARYGSAAAGGLSPRFAQLAGVQLPVVAHARGAARAREGRRTRSACRPPDALRQPGRQRLGDADDGDDGDDGDDYPLAAARLRDPPHRSSDSMVFVGVEGCGELRVGQRHFPIEPHDVLVVPGWMAYTLHATDGLVLSSYSDRVAQEKLGFWRERRQ